MQVTGSEEARKSDQYLPDIKSEQALQHNHDEGSVAIPLADVNSPNTTEFSSLRGGSEPSGLPTGSSIADTSQKNGSIAAESESSATDVSNANGQQDMTQASSPAPAISQINSPLPQSKRRTSTPEQKRRRLNNELGFSQPGRAFQLHIGPDQETGTPNNETRTRHSSRPTRPSRIAMESKNHPPQKRNERCDNINTQDLPGRLERCQALEAKLLRDDLDKTHKEHDALVRELFHLTKFVTMTSYDPDAAKSDQSEVFRQFQQHHDLAAKLMETDQRGITRSTRHSRNQQRRALGLDNATFPSQLRGKPKPSRSTSSDLKRKVEPRKYRDSSRPNEVIGLVPLVSAKLNPRKVPSLPLMHPLQRPLPASKPSGSLEALFASYVTWDDEVVSSHVREQRIARDIYLYKKLDEYRRQGKSIQPIATPNLQKLKPQEAPKPKSHHDHLLDGAVFRARAMHQARKHRVQLAKKVSRMISTYWERALHSDEREQKLEEKRMRALAKWTAREVNRQWRLAVTVIRSQKQAFEKAEREKMGKKQLQAIIEQSTHMLESQHADLSMRQSDDEQDPPSSTEEEQESESEDDIDSDEAHHHRSSVSEQDSEEEPSDELESIQSHPDDQDDEALEQQMWDEQDEEDEDEDEDEDADLAQDAELSLEELKKKYGYKDESRSPVQSPSPSKSKSTIIDDAMQSDQDRKGIAEPIDWQESKYTQISSADSAHQHKVRRESEKEGLSPAESTSSVVSHDVNAESVEENEGAGEAIAISSPSTKDNELPLIRPPFLLRGTLRPYQQKGLEWLVSLYNNNVNGILADEMGLGKTIQTIALLAYLACERGIWGPHLVVAPTSVMLNWEMEFKKFLPGFKILSYYGTQKQRKAKRVGWNTENCFNVCITSYQLVLADQHIFRRKPWMYLVLDEAHNIKNFRSQRWQTLLGFNSQRRLLLTGTPLQNNLMDLWSLMYFLMPQGIAEVAAASGAFSNLKDFQEWFSNPLGRAAENSDGMDEETRATVAKLHTVLRPYVLRRLKSDVEREMPKKYEHVLPCRLSKRQRFLYNDFMSRARTRESLASGNYMSIINCLMQLRKVCNHPDLFEPRPTVTPFVQSRSVAAEYQIKDLLVRKRLLQQSDDQVNLDVLNLHFTHREPLLTPLATRRYRNLQASDALRHLPPPCPVPVLSETSVQDLRYALSISRSNDAYAHAQHLAYLNRLRCDAQPILGRNMLQNLRELGRPKLVPSDICKEDTSSYWTRCEPLCSAVQSYMERSDAMTQLLTRFAFATPPAVASGVAQAALPGVDPMSLVPWRSPEKDPLHRAAVQLNISFPDASLLQYDCGKLQQLDQLMRRLIPNGHRILIFTQMTKVLDILEKFFNYQGYRYLRLDGATKVEQRQVLTERFNRDPRISAFILSTRSGGLGINLVGADTVLFYDLDWNAAIESQCMDRAHRIGQTRDVHIYRFVSQHTIEENMLRKANQKRRLDSLVIQQGEFTTDHLLRNDWRDMLDEGTSLGGVQVGDDPSVSHSTREVDHALTAAEDAEDAAAAHAAQQEMQLDQADFAAESIPANQPAASDPGDAIDDADLHAKADAENDAEVDEDLIGSIDDYMLKFVEADWDFFVQ
ncbi:DNA helicase [Malassezia yamatoensis]|uniref:Helicase SWR1 n=1 Tax=Malassezia yamatoensis TaxID=253288 RepID=A0AAJ5YTW9_9BASI|nr:DNA helicase [Malassezia yamatoensis]